MPYVADDPFAGFDPPTLADDPFSDYELPEAGASVAWAGRKVSPEAIRRVAEQNEVSPETIMRLGTFEGRFKTQLAESDLGSVGLRAVEGVKSIGENIGAAVSRAVGRDDISARIHEGQRQRQELLQLIEKEGAIGEALGDRGARVFNNTVQSLGEIGVVGATTGPTGVYSYIVGSSWEEGLDEGQREGLYGGELVGHAGRSAAIEGGMTFLMGRVGAKLGISTLEESFSPAMRNAAQSFLRTPGMKAKLARASRELGGWTSEGVEEMLISGGQQINEISSGMRGEFDWSEVIESGASGVLGRGSIGAAKGLHKELSQFEAKLPDIVSGVRAAEIDMERGINPFETKDIRNGQEFDRQTGRKETTKQFRDSYREALDFYIDEMRRDGQTGALAKMEQDVRRLREEERQQAARAKATKASAKRNKGRAGESVVSTEPVQETPIQTANERATFSLADFESRVNPLPADTLTPTQPNVNPYLLAPWETETRPQRRLRTLTAQVKSQKETIRSLRQAVVDNKRLTKEQQNDALDMVRDSIPAKEQHKFFKGVLDSTRPSAVNRLLDRVLKFVDRRDHKLAVDGLKESFRKATNLRPEFAEQVNSIKASVDLKRFNGRAAAESLRKWADENPHAILSDQQSHLLSRLEQQSVHGMTADDVRALSDHVERLAYQSATKDRLIYNEESASLRDTGDMLSRSIAAAPRKEMKSDSFVQQVKADLKGEALDKSLETDRTIGSLLFHEVAERPEATLSQLSPELGVELYGRIRAARGQYKLRRAATNRLMSDTFNALGLEHADTLRGSLSHRLGGPSTKLEGWRSKKRVIGGVKLTRGEAFWLALSTRDPVALENLMEAGVELESGKRKLAAVTPTTIKQLFDFIGPEGETMVDVAFEHLNTYVIDGVNEANEKMVGRPLTDKRNVVPMVKAEDEYAKFLTEGRTSAGFGQAVADSYGHLKRREGGLRALKLPAGMDGIDMFMSHADRMHRFASYAVPARNSEMLLNDAPVKQSIIEKNGERGYASIVDAVRSEVAGFGSTDELTRGLSSLNHTVAGAIIGGRLSVMMAQSLDTIVASPYDEAGTSDLLEGVNNELSRRGPTAVFEEMKRVLSAHSGEWNGRYESNNYAGEVTSGIFKRRGYFRPATIVEHATDPLKKSELLQAAIPNYMASKVAARRQLGLQPNDFEAYENDPAWVKMVVESWERKTVRGSNSSDPMELSSALRYAKKNPLAGLVTNFYNTAGKVYTLFSMAQNHIDRGNVTAAGKFAAAGMASTLLFSALQTALTQSEEEKKNNSFWQRWLGRSAKNIVSLNPAGGQIIADSVVGPALNMPRYDSNPVLLAETGVKAVTGAAELLAQLSQSADEQEDREKRIKTMINFGRNAGPLLGLPTQAVIDLAQRIQRGTIFTGLQPAESNKPPTIKKIRTKRNLL